MGLLAEARAKSESGGLLAQAKKRLGIPVPSKYAGTLGDLSRLGGPSFATKTSTQAIPDATTGPNPITAIPKTLAQGLAQGFAATGAELASVPGRLKDVAQGRMPSVPFGQSQFVPTGKIQQAILGTDQPISYATTGKLPFVPDSAAPIVGAFFGGLDLTGAGGGIRGLKGLTTALKNADNVADVSRLMKGAGFTDDIIKDYSTLFAKTTDAAQIEKGLLAAEKLQNTTVARGVSARKADTSVPFDGGETFYHGTTKGGAENIEKSGFVITKGGTNTGLGVSFSADRVAAETFATKYARAKGAKPGSVFEVQVAKDIRFVPENEWINYRNTIAEAKTKNLSGTDKINKAYAEASDEANRYFQVQGYDGVDFRSGKEVVKGNEQEVRVWNLDKVRIIGKDGIPTATPTRSATAPVGTAVRPTPSVPKGIVPPEASVPPTQSSSSLELNHISPENASGFKQAAENGASVAKDKEKYWRNVSKLGKAWNETVETIQNKDRLVKVLMESKGMKVTDATNIYQKMTRYVGIVGDKVERAQLRGERIMNDVARIAHNSSREIADVRADVNKYLHAVHAPERNVALGDGAAGMTTAQAVKELERINALPNAAEIKRAAEELRKINEEGLVLLKDAGVISDELFATLTTKYKNHVPLNRVLEGDDIQAALSVRGFDVKSTGIKKAKGSEKEVADIFSNIMYNYEQAVLRSEKNIVDQSTAAFVRANKEALGDLMVIKKPRAIGKNFEGQILMEHTTDPQYLQFYEAGKPVWVYIKDPELAVALRGVGNDKLGKVMQITGAATRVYSGLMTRYNLEFGPPNKLRDLQEMMVYAAAQKDLGFGAAAKMAVKDPISIKSVAEFYIGADTPGARLYSEMKALGGTTGGMGLSTRSQATINVDKMMATAASRPRQMFEDTLRYIDNYNAILEDSTRLSVYKQALAQGASKERAAFLAKESTINFNRMGKGGPVINALYMFSNASIQGSAKLIQSLKNPKVAAAVFTTVGASVAAVNQWNDTVDPQWRDKVTKWDRLNSLPVVLPGDGGADDSKGLVRSSSGIRYIALPVSWGLKPIKVMADFGYDAASGVNVDVAQVASDFFTSILDAYNPVGGTDLASSVTPTFIGPFPADLINEVYRNQSWSGSKIRPDYDQNAPADVQYFKSLGESASGKVFIESTKQLQEMTGIAISPADAKYVFENLIGGAGRFTTKTGNSLFGIATGEPLPLDEFPFVSRFYRERDAEETGQGAAGEVQEVNKLLQTQSRERFYVKKEAEQLYEQWSNIPKEEARANWNALNKENPDLAKKITEIARQEAKGLTYFERQITELGVENGERAKYLFGKFNELKTSEEKRALWELYSDKKIITEDVAKQLKYLIANPEVIKQSNAGTGTSASQILGALTGARTAQAAKEVAPGTLKAQPQTIGEFFRGETRLERTPTEPAMGQKLDPEAIRRGITGVENSGNANSYEVVGVTGDLGRYQASPQTVANWSKSWLGKKYTKQEFLADPDAQEAFFNQYLAVAKRYNLTPEETAVAWHAGWGELGTGPRETREARFRAKLAAQMKTPENQRYVKKFSTFINS